jgi:hypothetical protein
MHIIHIHITICTYIRIQDLSVGDVSRWQLVARSWVRSPLTELLISMLLILDMGLAIYEYSHDTDMGKTVYADNQATMTTFINASSASSGYTSSSPATEKQWTITPVIMSVRLSVCLSVSARNVIWSSCTCVLLCGRRRESVCV